MTLILSDFISIEMLDKFVNAYNSLGKDEKLNVYMKSEGGIIWIYQIMVDMVNTNPDKFLFNFNIQIDSAAFNLAMEIKCEKHLLNNTTGRVHLPYSSYDVDAMNNIKYADPIDKDFVDTYLDLYKKVGLTKKEINLILKGKDILLPYSRLKTIFENSKS